MLYRGLSALLCASLISQTVFAQSFSAPSAGNTGLEAEISLIETAISLQGLGLSSDELQAKLDSALSAYDRASAPEGRPERYAAALSRMGLLAPALAGDQVSEVRQAVAAGHGADARELAAISSRYLRSPAGLQYTDCQVFYTALPVFLMGLICDLTLPDGTAGAAGSAFISIAAFAVGWVALIHAGSC